MSQSRRETLNIDLILLHFAIKLIRILQREDIKLDRTFRMLLVSSEGTPDTRVPIT